MKHLLTLALLFGALGASAQELVERTLTGTSKMTNPAEARQDILDQVSLKLTEDLARELLGEDRFLKNRSLILGKVAKASARFIPLQKPGALQKTAEGHSMPVTLRASLPSLRQVLQENGLLNENTAAPLLLPVVSFQDRVNMRTDRWWVGEESGSKTFLRTLGREFESSLRSGFRRQGFFVVRPQSSALTASVPEALRVEDPGPEDLQLLGDWFGAPLVIDGNVSLQRPSSDERGSRIEVRLTVRQTANNRPIADVSRSYAVDDGAFEATVERKWREVVDALSSDLAAQVLEAWQKGSVGSSQLRMVLEPRPTLPEIEQLKERLRSSSAGIRSVRERLIDAKQLTFEVESPVTAADLATRLRGFEFNGRVFETSVKDNEVWVRLQTRQGGNP